MTEHGEGRSESQASAADSAAPLAGERLARARREKQISIDEIAKELHIDDYKVRALERNDFEVLGAPVFAKGHLRKYAQLVGVPVGDVLADYYALNRSVGLPPLVARVRPESREINLGRWLAVLLLLGLAAGAYWWFVGQEAPRTTVAAGDSGRVSLPPAADTVVTDAVDAADDRRKASRSGPAGAGRRGRDDAPGGRGNRGARRDLYATRWRRLRSRHRRHRARRAPKSGSPSRTRATAGRKSPMHPACGSFSASAAPAVRSTSAAPRRCRCCSATPTTSRLQSMVPPTRSHPPIDEG